MKSSTVQLRLRGLMPGHLVMSLVAAVPIARIAYATVVQHLPYPTREPLMTAVCALLAVLPWLWRAFARAAYRAKCDDIAVHVRGEALPYKTIKELRVEQDAPPHHAAPGALGGHRAAPRLVGRVRGAAAAARGPARAARRPRPHLRVIR